MVAESISQAVAKPPAPRQVRRSDATNFPNGGFPSGRDSIRIPSGGYPRPSSPWQPDQFANRRQPRLTYRVFLGLFFSHLPPCLRLPFSSSDSLLTRRRLRQQQRQHHHPPTVTPLSPPSPPLLLPPHRATTTTIVPLPLVLCVSASIPLFRFFFSDFVLHTRVFLRVYIGMIRGQTRESEWS